MQYAPDLYLYTNEIIETHVFLYYVFIKKMSIKCIKALLTIIYLQVTIATTSTASTQQASAYTIQFHSIVVQT